MFNAEYTNRPEVKNLIAALAGINKSIFTTAEGLGAPLIREYLSDIITLTVFDLIPELQMIEWKYHSTDNYHFDRLLKLPEAGSFAGEASDLISSTPEYEKAFIKLKVLLKKCETSGFLDAMTGGGLDADRNNIWATIKAIALDLRANLYFGNTAADPYSPDGYYYNIRSNRIVKAQGGEVPTDFSDLDYLVENTFENGAESQAQAFFMSAAMQSLYSTFLTNVRDNREAHPGVTGTRMVNGGLVIESYRQIPIMLTTGLKPEKNDIGTISVGSSGTGATIPDDEYFFRVAPVTRRGPQIASAEGSETTTGADTLDITWTPHPNAMYYAIYAGKTANETYLVKVVSGVVRDATGKETDKNTGVTFTTDPTIADSDSVPTELQNERPLVRTNGIAPEHIFLISYDPVQGFGEGVYGNRDGSEINGVITVEPLAKVKDVIATMFKGYLNPCVPRFEKTSGCITGVRPK
jgi:hypothetical protein